jgi:hypothetical protein
LLKFLRKAWLSGGLLNLDQVVFRIRHTYSHG